MSHVNVVLIHVKIATEGPLSGIQTLHVIWTQTPGDGILLRPWLHLSVGSVKDPVVAVTDRLHEMDAAQEANTVTRVTTQTELDLRTPIVGEAEVEVVEVKS